MSPHSNTRIHPPSPTPLPSPSYLYTHTHQLPLQTPNHAKIGKESHCNQHNLFSSYHTKGEKIKKALQSITAHCTALSSHHWHLGERLSGGGRRGEGGRYLLSCPLLGTSPVLWPSSGPLVSWQQRATVDRRMAAIIVSNHIKVTIVS